MGGYIGQEAAKDARTLVDDSVVCIPQHWKRYMVSKFPLHPSACKATACSRLTADTLQGVPASHNIFILIIAGMLVFQVSTTSLAQWTQTSFPPNQTVKSLIVHNGILFAGTPDSGVYVSSDAGSTWIARRNGLPPGSSYTLVVHRGAIFSGGGACIYRSTDSGLSWTVRNITYPLHISVEALTADSADIFAGTSVGIFRSSNEGSTWLDISPTTCAVGITSITVADTILLAGSSWPLCGLHRSTNRGASWDGRIDTMPPFSGMTALLFIDSMVVAGVDLGFVSGGILRSTDLGITWGGADSGSLYTQSIRSFAYAGNTLFAGSAFVNTSMYISNDFGRTSRAIGPGLPSGGVGSITVLDSFLFVAPAGSGIWKRPLSQIVPVTLSQLSAYVEEGYEKFAWRTESETNTQGFEIQRREAPGAEWALVGFVLARGSSSGPESYEYTFQAESPLIPRPHIQYRLKIVDFDGSYEYSAPVDLVTSDNELDFRLHASYPNPSKGRITLTFSLPREEHVRLTVVNMLGMVVHTLVDGELSAGVHSVPFDTSVLPRGMYLCVLKTDTGEAVTSIAVQR